MRRLLEMVALLAPVLLTAAVTAGCAAGPAPRPTVAGSFGSDPVVTLPPGKPPGHLLVQTIHAGGGPVVRGADYVLFEVQGKVWNGDREIADSFTDHQPQGLPLSSAMPAWRHLAGQRVGSRVLMVVPPGDGFGSGGDPAAGVTGNDTLVFVFDLLAALPAGASATGAAVGYQPGAHLPSIRAGTGGPAVTVPRGEKPPAGLVTRVLIRGRGPAVQAGQTVIVQDTGVVWRTGKVFDSSWQRRFPEAFRLGAGQVIPALEKGLTGVPAGSRVLLVVPPALGYGSGGDPSAGITGNDTLVFVIDVLTAIG